LVSALYHCDDPIGIGVPDEWFRGFIVFGHEAIDGGLEIDERSEHAALQATFAELREETFHGVKPGARRRYEMEGKAQVPSEPRPDLRVLVSGIVVQDQVHFFVRRTFTIDPVEESMNSSWRWRCMLRPITVPSCTAGRMLDTA
jgi:hypothetical protein